MVEGGAGTEFPVVFYDGEKEINIGSIKVYPMQVFKAFQLMLSQRIGISPNQISIYLCDSKDSIFGHRRKIPITGKSNFAHIVLEKDSYFQVVLKRSRKSRNRILRERGSFLHQAAIFNNFPVDDLIRLPQNQEMDLAFELGFGLQFYPNPNLFQRIQDTYPMMMTNNLIVCEECRGKNGNFKSSMFHHCVNDPVVFGGFKSRFGPVGEPVKFH